MNKTKMLMGMVVGVSCAIAIIGSSGGASAQTAAPGARVFAAKCQACHSVDRAKGSAMAPNLAGIAGRKAGAVPRFAYSPAMVRSNIVWNAANLDAFLSAPQRVVRGNRMAFAGMANAKDRSDLIAFLNSKK